MQRAHVQHAAIEPRSEHGSCDKGDKHGIEHRTRPHDAERHPLVVRGRIEIAERVITYETLRAIDAVHDVVTRIDAQGALDALELRAIADVDAHGANGDAGLAVDTVAVAFPALALL